jgi:membrane peptidoglycan carboxypeptidase
VSSVPQIIRRRRERRQQKRPGTAWYGGLSAVALLLIGVLGAVLGTVALAVSLYMGVANAIPTDPQALLIADVGTAPSQFLDRTGGSVLYAVSNPTGMDSTWRSLDVLPQVVVDATIAIEDGAYYDRPAFSLPELVNALQDAFVMGRSNLTDPILLYLVRHVVVPLHEMPLDHPDRLHTDVILTMELRRRFSREDLLEWFLNTALYGNGTYGIEAAAQYYLDKPASDLTLAEAALLAVIPANPSINPFDQPDVAQRRQEVVLDTMTAYAMIGPDEAEAASAPLAVTRALAPADVVAPHFALAARRQAEVVLNQAGYDGARLVAGGGLRITTSLDLALQYQAECALRTHVTRLSGVDPAFVYATTVGGTCEAAAYLPDLAPQDVGVPHDVTNGSVVVMAPDSGQVLAYVGSMDYWNEAIGGPVDLVANARQPGSLIRPYVYLTALAQGYTTATMTLDVYQQFPQAFGVTYEADSPGGEYRGPLSLREALVYDAVPPAVQVMNWVGVDDVIRTAHSMGLTTLLDGPSSYDLSLAEQGGTATLGDLAFSMGVLANGGHMVGTQVPVAWQQPGFRTLDPVLVISIEDAAGNLLWEYTPQQRDTLDPALAYLMNDMLGDRELRTQVYGDNHPLEIDRPAAVQAGASSDARDLWTVGYTPQLTVGVWLGNVDNAPVTRLDALNGPAAIWQSVMRYANLRYSMPVVDWAPPLNIVEQPVCAVSGLLPTAYCPVVMEVFADGTQPTRADYYYQMVEVNRSNGKRATASTPRDLVEERVYFVYPEGAQEWASAQGIESIPAEYDSIGAPPVVGPVAILDPDPLAYVNGSINVQGNATLPAFQYYQLAYGAGLNPTDWIQIGDRIFTPARGALLGRWDTTGLEGLYSLRLTVVTAEQEVQESVIQVTVDNTPPNVQVDLPTPDSEVFASGNNPVMSVAVTYNDNVGVSEVVYYLDGEAVTTAIEPPFNASVVLESLGSHSIWAEAFDAAGNSALSERVTFTVRRGS